VDTWGKIDVLVNNAAVIWQKNILTITLEEFKEMMDNNCTSVFLGMKCCYPFGGIKAGPGTGNDAGYNASKAAVGFVKKTV
jgi:NADP-dependent 3-hydroxy acid dehydrogenase YdfG